MISVHLSSLAISRYSCTPHGDQRKTAHPPHPDTMLQYPRTAWKIRAARFHQVSHHKNQYHACCQATKDRRRLLSHYIARRILATAAGAHNETSCARNYCNVTQTPSISSWNPRILHLLPPEDTF